MHLTYRLRLRDKHASELNRQARAVNIVWNYCNEVQKKAAQSGRKWLGYHDLAALTSGAGPELGLHSHTIQRVCRAYDTARKTDQKPWLRWRSKRSLGWVPYNTGHVSFDGTCFVFRGLRYETMHRRPIPEGTKFGAGSFSQDAKGHWYINVVVEVPEVDRAPVARVGIDLGLKDLATLSTGERIEMPRFYRASEEKLAKAQRARKSRRVKAIQAKIANRRKDFLHKAANKITDRFGLIVIGDVSPSKLAKTRMAKSVLDAGWAGFKAMLSWKVRLRSGGMVLEVCEAYTTQACAECGSIAGPKGRAGLNERVWVCGDCGAEHDRDVNAARNILAAGHRRLVGGNPVL